MTTMNFRAAALQQEFSRLLQLRPSMTMLLIQGVDERIGMGVFFLEHLCPPALVAMRKTNLNLNRIMWAFPSSLPAMKMMISISVIWIPAFLILMSCPQIPALLFQRPDVPTAP